jgi:hypothetical protein
MATLTRSIFETRRLIWREASNNKPGLCHFGQLRDDIRMTLVIYPAGLLTKVVLFRETCIADLILKADSPLMTLLIIILVLVLLCGGGGYAYRGPVGGGGGLGLVLIILLVLYLMGYL